MTGRILMNRFAKTVLALFMVLVLTGTASAFDLNTLDQVSVLMDISKVRSLLGTPQTVTDAGNGLKVEIYEMSDVEPMLGAACIYDPRGRLAGQAFVFDGNALKPAAARLVEHGFRLVDEKGGVSRLEGKDDDTGQPLVVVISEVLEKTAIVTFEKGFYENLTR
jgi:hypothetical protein